MSYSDNAIATKARAMYGQRLTSADYDMMLKMSTVPEVASYLKSSTHYRSMLAGLDEHEVHRGQLEASLRGLRYEQYTRLIRYHFAQGEDFYRFLFLREEVEQILGLLRYIGAGSEGEYYFTHSRYLERYCSFSLEGLSQAQSYQDLLDVLDGTPYEAILRRYPPRLEEQKNRIDLVACERDLKTHYYKTVFDQVRRGFSGKAREALEDAFLGRVAAENINAAYRLRRFFHATPEEVRRALLPFATPWDKVIGRIAEAASAAQLDQVLTAAKLIEHPITGDDTIEIVTLRIQEHISRKDLRYSVYPAVVLAAYIFQMEIELENVINIIEAIRYNLPAQDVRGLLILSA